jgi:hypothetical protein
MRHSVKLLGLALLAAVSVMALTAVAAQAEGELFVNKVKVGTSEPQSKGQAPPAKANSSCRASASPSNVKKAALPPAAAT